MSRIEELSGRCLHELFEEQARRTPEAVALEDRDVSLTYAELDGLAGRLASYLRSKDVGPDDPVGVFMERRAEYVIACLAAMKAGGAYLVLELAYPPPLLADVMSDAGPRLVLTQERYTDRLPEGTETFCLDAGWDERLAAYLRSKNVALDEPDGVYMERRAEYVIACLAAMKAGGAYLVL